MCITFLSVQTRRNLYVRWILEFNACSNLSGISNHDLLQFPSVFQNTGTHARTHVHIKDYTRVSADTQN